MISQSRVFELLWNARVEASRKVELDTGIKFAWYDVDKLTFWESVAGDDMQRVGPYLAQLEKRRLFQLDKPSTNWRIRWEYAVKE